MTQHFEQRSATPLLFDFFSVLGVIGCWVLFCFSVLGVIGCWVLFGVSVLGVIFGVINTHFRCWVLFGCYSVLLGVIFVECLF